MKINTKHNLDERAAQVLDIQTILLKDRRKK